MSLYWVAHSDLTKAFDKVHILCSLREEWLFPINVSVKPIQELVTSRYHRSVAHYTRLSVAHCLVSLPGQ